MRFEVVSIMPQMFAAICDYGITARAIKRGLMSVHCHNPRQHCHDAHQSVDDRPFGGGPGMVMKAKPLLDSVAAIQSQYRQAVPVVYLSPQGQQFKQADAKRLASLQALILVAGRYEGVDERFVKSVDFEYSLGDFVISGGELAAMVMIDAIARLLPNVLGHELSAEQDSFSDGLLDCPHYTRPSVVAGMAVPAVLQSGDHARIASWRRREALLRTQARRPDLISAMQKNGKLSDMDHLWLQQSKLSD